MKRNLITVDKVLADLEHDKLLAREHHQYGVAKGCSELQGKFLAMFTEKHITETVETPQRTPEELEAIEAAARVYKLHLAQEGHQETAG